MDVVDGCMVLASAKPKLVAMKAAAKADGVTLILVSGYRPFSQQLDIRRRYRKAFEDDLTKRKIPFVSRVNDERFLLMAPSREFLPAAAAPGMSNHHDGGAYDWRVKDNPATKDVDESKAFEWLKRRAIEFEMIRTVASERWHWEFRPGKAQYSVVPDTHLSWKV